MGKREELARLQSQRGTVNLSGVNNPNIIDMFLGDDNTDKSDELITVPLSKLLPFKNHIFHLYQGERLDEMVKSIHENGVIIPIIVRPVGNYYEILSGHNRSNASKIAGLSEIKVIVKYNLTEDEAELITITTNLNQRSIEDMKISELSWALRRQNDILKHQGKSAIDHDGLKFTVDKIGNGFKLSASNVKRYIRLTYLSEDLLRMVDDNTINFVSGVSISFLRIEEMRILYDYIITNNYKLTPKIAEHLKKSSQESENVIDIKSILDEYNKTADKSVKPIKLTTKELGEYIPESDFANAKDIIIKGLQLYYSKA